MSKKRHKPEEIVAKLRHGDVLTSLGQVEADNGYVGHGRFLLP